jgi:TnpA family transposase
VFFSISYGCKLGPAQIARPFSQPIQPQQPAWANYRHIDQDKLEAVRTAIIDGYAGFELPYHWGSGQRVGADGTKFALNPNNLNKVRFYRPPCSAN